MEDLLQDAIVTVPGSDDVEQKRRAQIEKNKGLIALLDEWLADPDAEEQKETWEFLRKALDEDRLSDRKLFP